MLGSLHCVVRESLARLIASVRSFTFASPIVVLLCSRSRVSTTGTIDLLQFTTAAHCKYISLHVAHVYIYNPNPLRSLLRSFLIHRLLSL